MKNKRTRIRETEGKKIRQPKESKRKKKKIDFEKLKKSNKKKRCDEFVFGSDEAENFDVNQSIGAAIKLNQT